MTTSHPSPTRTQTPVRRSLMQSIVLGGVASLVWILGVAPLAREVDRKRASLASASAELETVSELSTGVDGDALLAGVTQRAATLKQWSGSTEEQALFYERVRALSAQNNVRVARIEPRGSNTVFSTDAQGRSLAVLERRGFGLEVTGSFEGVVRFIEACERELGAGVIEAFSISPAPARNDGGSEADRVIAMVEVTRLQLTTAMSSALEGATP